MTRPAAIVDPLYVRFALAATGLLRELIVHGVLTSAAIPASNRPGPLSGDLDELVLLAAPLPVRAVRCRPLCRARTPRDA